MLIHDPNCELEDFETHLGNLYEDMDAKVRQTSTKLYKWREKYGKKKQLTSAPLPT